MRSRIAMLVGLSLTAPLAGSCAPAGARSEGPPRVTQRFDPRAVETVDGQVLGVDRIPARDQLSSGVHITLRDDLGHPLSVDLAPGWYLDAKGLHFGARERVQVRGVRTQVAGQPAFIAEEVRKGGKVVRLRDKQGRPLWSPRRSPPAASGAAPPLPAAPAGSAR